MTPVERAKLDQHAIDMAERWAVVNWAFYYSHVRIGFSQEYAVRLTAEHMANLQLMAQGKGPDTEE